MNAAKPPRQMPPDESSLPKEVRVRLAAAEEQITAMDRQAFERQIDELAEPIGNSSVGFITAAMRDHLKRDFDLLHATRLRSASGAEVRGEQAIVGLLRELRAHTLLMRRAERDQAPLRQRRASTRRAGARQTNGRAN